MDTHSLLMLGFSLAMGIACVLTLMLSVKKGHL